MAKLIRISAAVLLGGFFVSAAAAVDDGATSADAASRCLQPGTWSLADVVPPTAADGSTLIADMAQREVVLLGEQHDDADHHRWQLQTLAALHARRPDMVIGFEMFPRRVQSVLDRWVAGELSEAQFLDEVEWGKVWSMPAELYLPLFHFARLNRIPMVALNVEQTLTRKIAAQGWDAVPEAEREGVGRAATPVESYVDFLFGVHRAHARSQPPHPALGPKHSDTAFRNFVDSQLTWDRAMAEALAGALRPAEAAAAPLVVGIVGSGHVRYGHGVAHQLRDLGVSRIGLLLPMPAATDCVSLKPGIADAVFAVPEPARPPAPPPRLGVSLEEHRDGVRVAEVAMGSLAARTGLRVGDIIIEAAGAPVRRSVTLVGLIRRQPAGTWLPLTLRREGERLELVVRFPRQP